MLSTESPPFQLPPLSSFADDCHPIRSLHLEPSGNPSAEIRCSLFQANLLDNPEFKALSYVWGIHSTAVPIIVNEQSYNVTPNCHTALRRLRDAGESPLWVEFICINQKDSAEKATRIPLMGDIYSQARQVIVELGYNDTEQTLDDEIKEKLAFGLIQDYESFIYNEEFYRLAQTRKMDQDMFLEIGGSGESPKARWSALKDLYDHKWFTRLWAHQEAGMATDCIVFT